MKNHISFSELVEYCHCSYFHYLKRIEEIPVEDNEFLAFGKAIHYVADVQVNSEEQKDWKEIFELAFLKELTEIKKKNPKKQLDENLVQEMRAQGKILSPIILPSLRDFFGDFEILGTEFQLYENIKNLNLLRDYNFKGFIDLIIREKKENKIIILDYKSCSWGWEGRKKSEKLVTYQLTYYKHFYAQKYNIDPKDIETYFCLLKRTAKKDNVEIFRVTSGEKKINNSLQLLEKTINGIIQGKKWKDKRYCLKCPYNDTNYCIK